VSAVEALKSAHDVGVELRVDGEDLVLEASAPPPAAVLDLLSRHKLEILMLLQSGWDGKRDTYPGTPRITVPRWPADGTPVQLPQALRDRTITHSPTFRARDVRRPPSWSDATVLPADGCLCSCCRNRRWWRETCRPTGWRCWTCHPPNHLPQHAITEIRT
jgi:hypothetical protein